MAEIVFEGRGGEIGSGTLPGPSLDSIAFAFAPSIPAIYPEYLADPDILVCPSDANPGRVRYETGPRAGESCISSVQRDPVGTCETGCMNDAHDSYLYLGWLQDKAEEDDPRLEETEPGGAIEDIEEIAELIPDSPCEPARAPRATRASRQASNTAPPLQGEVLFEVWLEDAFTQIGMGNWSHHPTDTDINLEDVLGGLDDKLAAAGVPLGTPVGNGNSNTVFRLREGIDRFLITDINNPGASAKAQSEIWTYFDTVSTNVEQFNHVPGGSNVLYLDGHVKFIRYPGKAPVNKVFSTFIGG